MKIHKTDDGWLTEGELYWEFIKSMQQVEQYDLFKSAIVKKTIIVRS